jgi:hypothetical protein
MIMKNRCLIGNAILWAAAILASAVIHAPFVLWGIIFPALAFTALIAIRPVSKDMECRK